MPVWQGLFVSKKPYDFVLKPKSSQIVRFGPQQSWISAKFSFKTRSEPRTMCSGHLGVVPDQLSPSGWKIWMITTILESLEGLPDPDHAAIAPDSILTNGLSNSHTDGLTNGLSNGATDVRTNNDSGNYSKYDCVVVGAGFAGLCLAGRLKAMGMRYTVLERNANVGDNWLNRYESARCMWSFPFGTKICTMVSCTNCSFSTYLQIFQ